MGFKLLVIRGFYRFLVRFYGISKTGVMKIKKKLDYGNIVIQHRVSNYRVSKIQRFKINICVFINSFDVCYFLPDNWWFQYESFVSMYCNIT